MRNFSFTSRCRVFCLGLSLLLPVTPSFSADYLPEGLRNKSADSYSVVPEAQQQALLDLQEIDTGRDFAGGVFSGLLLPLALGAGGAFVGSRIDGGGLNDGAGFGFLGGYLAGAIGGTLILCNDAGTPEPDSAKVQGRSSQYRACYTGEFKKQGKNKKHHEALLGSIVGIAAPFVLIPLVAGIHNP